MSPLKHFVDNRFQP